MGGRQRDRAQKSKKKGGSCGKQWEGGNGPGDTNGKGKDGNGSGAFWRYSGKS